MAQTLKVTMVGAEAAKFVTDRSLRGRDDLVYVQSSAGDQFDAIYPAARAARILKRSVTVYGAVVVDEAGLGF